MTSINNLIEDQLAHIAAFIALICTACLIAGPSAQSQNLGHIGVEVGFTTSSQVSREDMLSVAPGFVVAVSARTGEVGGAHLEVGIIQRARHFAGGIWEGTTVAGQMDIRSTYVYGATLLRVSHSFGRVSPHFLAGPRANFNISGDDSRPTAVIALTAGAGVVVEGLLPIKTTAGFRFNQDLTSISTLFNIRHRILEFRVGVEF